MSRPGAIAGPIVAAVLLSTVLAGCQGATPAGVACGIWSRVPSPNSGAGFNSLDGVAVASSSDAWAVGAYKGDVDAARSLTLRWDGVSWSRVQSPSVGARGTFLNDVAVVAPDDVWAVGAVRNEPGIARTYTQHWDGSRWTAVASPNIGGGDNFLVDVAAVAEGDVWAAGYRHHGNATRSMIVHWNGRAWAILPFHVRDSLGDGLNAITAASADDVWAVGGFSARRTGTNTLVIHWDGARWHTVTSANVGVHGNSLTGVAAVSPTDAWAVGGFRDYGGDRTLIVRAGREAWTLHPSPRSEAVSDDLNDVAAGSSNEVWAVGTAFDGGQDHTLIMRGDGETWRRVPSPDPGVLGSRLADVATGSGGEAWAVGTFFGARPGRTLILHYCPA